jgi:peptidoglycan/LPS O-acetylase OafA/YrhL
LVVGGVDRSREEKGPLIDTTSGRTLAWDLVRSFAIFFTFLGHTIIFHTSYHWMDRLFATLSPGLTMSLLGFTSAALLAGRDSDDGAFLLRRFIRIYVPLIVCLAAVVALQAAIGTLTVTPHIAIHFMGLSGVFSLLSVPNKASIGMGLWFVTTILVMYMLLPALRRLFVHRRGFLHLLIVIALCIYFNRRFEPADENWNVVIAFCIGTWIVVNGRLDRFTHRPAGRSAIMAVIVLTVCALATWRIIPYEIRSLLYPFYPVAFIPLFFALSPRLPGMVAHPVTYFALVSFEFYILQFYFIGSALKAVIRVQLPLIAGLPVAFVLTLAAATILYGVDSRLRRVTEDYLLGSRS